MSSGQTIPRVLFPPTTISCSPYFQVSGVCDVFPKPFFWWTSVSCHVKPIWVGAIDCPFSRYGLSYACITHCSSRLCAHRRFHAFLCLAGHSENWLDVGLIVYFNHMCRQSISELGKNISTGLRKGQDYDNRIFDKALRFSFDCDSVLPVWLSGVGTNSFRPGESPSLQTTLSS